MDNEVKTNWTKATQNPSEALISLVACIEAGKNAWIELRENGDQSFPVMKKNPELDNPFNWEMQLGTPRNKKELLEHKYFNETEKDIVNNWTNAYGTPEAIKAYQEEGRIEEGLMLSCGRSHLVRIEDADWYREHITKDNYKYGSWVTWVAPKKGIPYMVLDKEVGKVFTICYSDEPCDRAEVMRKAAQFLLDYADEIA